MVTEATTIEQYYSKVQYVQPDPVHMKDFEQSPVTPTQSENWQDSALCKGIHGAISPFFAHGYESKKERIEREEIAKKICGQCAVRAECLNFALRIREQHGVWGGLNEKERKQLKKSATS